MKIVERSISCNQQDVTEIASSFLQLLKEDGVHGLVGDLAQRIAEGDIREGKGTVIAQCLQMEGLIAHLTDLLALKQKRVIQTLAKVIKNCIDVKFKSPIRNLWIKLFMHICG